MKKIWLSVMMVLLSFLHSFSQTKPHRVKVYLLGTFHFAQTDSSYNVLDKNHQQSIQEINDRVVGLKPDKIFIERMPDFENESRIDSLYTVYFQRTKETTNPDEIWQIAFKSAKRLGHHKVYQCDHPGMFGSLYAEVDEYAQKNNQMPVLEYHTPGVTRPYTVGINTDSLRHAVSLLEYVRWLNSGKVQETSHAHYVNVYPQTGHTDVYDYRENYLLGTEITADWYRRNIYIYSKMINQVDYSEEAILLLMGNDHIPIIRHLFQSNPYFEVVDTASWLGKTSVRMETP